MLKQIDDEKVADRLTLMRSEGLSKRTSNHYVRAVKQFGSWLVRTQRLHKNPLESLPMLNADTDRRHRRRPLSYEELALVVDAAKNCDPVEGICGPDRAMMYVLAAWTGYRRGEIGSLSLESFELQSDPPRVTVEASYSKRRKRDTHVLHPGVAKAVTQWLAGHGELKAGEPLFPVSDAVPGSVLRKTSKMMRVDLRNARKKWIDDAKMPEEQERREKSD